MASMRLLRPQQPGKWGAMSEVHKNDSSLSDIPCGATPGFRVLAIYVANILLIGGAVLISVLPGTASSPWVFGGLLVGHVCLSMHALRIRDRGLIFLNVAMALLDLYAVGIRL